MTPIQQFQIKFDESRTLKWTEGRTDRQTEGRADRWKDEGTNRQDKHDSYDMTNWRRTDVQTDNLTDRTYRVYRIGRQTGHTISDSKRRQTDRRTNRCMDRQITQDRHDKTDLTDNANSQYKQTDSQKRTVRRTGLTWRTAQVVRTYIHWSVETCFNAVDQPLRNSLIWCCHPALACKGVRENWQGHGHPGNLYMEVGIHSKNQYWKVNTDGVVRNKINKFHRSWPRACTSQWYCTSLILLKYRQYRSSEKKNHSRIKVYVCLW